MSQVNAVTEHYEIVCPIPPLYTAAKDFLLARFPAGNPLGYVVTWNDTTRTCYLDRAYTGWTPPAP